MNPLFPHWQTYPVFEPHDDRPLLAKAIGLAYAVIAISVEMVAPIALGYWADRRWSTAPALVLLGVVLGLVAGLYGLLGLVRPRSR